MTIKDGHEPKYIFKEDNNGKRGVVLTFVGEHQKKGKPLNNVVAGQKFAV